MRPRWVWAGIALALVGTCLIGIGVVTTRWSVSWPGLTLVLAGGAAALRGRVMSDAGASVDIGREVEEVAQGGSHRGHSPGTAYTDAEKRAAAREIAADTRARTRSSWHHPAVRWTPAAGAILLAIGAVTGFGMWVLIAPTATGRSNSLRLTALAIVLCLAGLRMLLVPGRHPLAVSAAGVGGVVLIISSLIADHDRAGLAYFEGAIGVLAVVCASVAWADATFSWKRSSRPGGPDG